MNSQATHQLEKQTAFSADRVEEAAICLGNNLSSIGHSQDFLNNEDIIYLQDDHVNNVTERVLALVTVVEDLVISPRHESVYPVIQESADEEEDCNDSCSSAREHWQKDSSDLQLQDDAVSDQSNCQTKNGQQLLDQESVHEKTFGVSEQNEPCESRPS